MLVLGTRMHVVTFLIIIFEMLFFFYQIVHYLSRPSDKKRFYYLILLYLLIQYNMASGLFPDPRYSLSITFQNIIIFGAGYIMGMYFPYYFYKVFNLKKMRFYAYWGSFLFLFLPFVFLFLVPYYITGDLERCKKFILIVAFLYALSFIYSLSNAIKNQSFEEKVLFPKNEIISVFIGSFFWISLPVISYFEVNANAFFEPIFDFNDTSQVIEMITTNAGLLIMTILFMRQSIRQSRLEYEKLLESEAKLQEMNLRLQKSNDELLLKVQERTKELELANEQRINTFINLAHDIKTPLILINNYLSHFVNKAPQAEALTIVQHNIKKLTKNAVNFFDSERIRKGIVMYDHEQISDFSLLINSKLPLFEEYCKKKNIYITTSVEEDIYIKSDPEALERIINNIVENAIKYTPTEGKIYITLKPAENGTIQFIVKDTGIGIPKERHTSVFDSFHQIESKKINSQGMGLGLSITKKIVEDLHGQIIINSDPEKEAGTEISMKFLKHTIKTQDVITDLKTDSTLFLPEIYTLTAADTLDNNGLPTLLIVEDNIQLINLICERFRGKYNFHIALNGTEAIDKLKRMKHLDLIISDVMMDKGDGFDLYENVLLQKRFRHIPFIFITAREEDKLKGLAMGAIDYILKPFLIDELIFKIDSVLANLSEQRKAVVESAYNSIIAGTSNEQVPAQLSQRKFEENCMKYNLTPQEKKIVPLIAKGQSNKEIASVLFISDKTVKKHLQNMFDKLDVTGKLELLHKLEIIVP